MNERSCICGRCELRSCDLLIFCDGCCAVSQVPTSLNICWTSSIELISWRKRAVDAIQVFFLTIAVNQPWNSLHNVAETVFCYRSFLTPPVFTLHSPVPRRCTIISCWMAVLCRMGTGQMDYKQLSQQIELKTGAMEAAPHLVEHHTNSHLFEQVTLHQVTCVNR